MRSTWILVAAVVAGGLLAWLSLASQDGGGGASSDAGGAAAESDATNEKRTALQRSGAREPKPAKPAPPRNAGAREALAADLVAGVRTAREAGDRKGAARIESELRTKAWDTDAARRYAVAKGHRLVAGARDAPRAERIRLYDRARRLLSRGLFLDEMFDPDSSDTAVRRALKARIQKLNTQVMTYPPGLEGVTARYAVPRGITPVQIVARRSVVDAEGRLTVSPPGEGEGEQLPMGPNAVMYWNQRGDLRATGMRAGATYLIPLEPLSLHVHQRVYRLALFIGDWFVKEYRVGVGQSDTPTPTGTFFVDSKEENPDWWYQGRRIPAGHADNELGAGWIAIHGDDLPLAAGIGIHGTNKSDTVGTRCSNGCVRLTNAEIKELMYWVRTDYDEGPATRVVVQ